MLRKKENPETKPLNALLVSREKKKWQLALRRYILGKSSSEAYARYYGLDRECFRKWIALQFTPGTNWENFGQTWQLSPVIPVHYFDLSKEDERFLCWNFINIRVSLLKVNKTEENRVDILAAKKHFQSLYQKTKYTLCCKMVDRIKKIEAITIEKEFILGNFIIEHKERIEKIAALTPEEFKRINKGEDLKNILLEKELVKKYG